MEGRMSFNNTDFTVQRDMVQIDMRNQGGANVSLDELAQELAKLRLVMRQRAETVSQDRAVAKIGEAQEAAQQGDRRGAVTALSQAGKWALEIATQLGVSVATEMLKKTVGA
jgi:hypothetical protein